MSAKVRLRQLQQLVLDPGFLGLEPLLDLLLGVHQELGASHLAQDKYVADFLQWGEYGQEAWGGVQGRDGSTGQERAMEGEGLERAFCNGTKQSSRPDPKLPWWATRVSEATYDSVQAGVGTASCYLCTHTRTWQLSLLGPLTPQTGFIALPGFPECGEGQRGAAARVWPIGRCLASASPAALTGVQEL